MYRNKLTFIAALLMLVMCTGCNKVPDVVGMKQEDAQKKLEKKKMTVQVTMVDQQGKTPGTVLDQDPKPKAKIPEDKKITLMVQQAAGAGTAGTGTSGTGSTTGSTTGTGTAGISVPDFTGMTQLEAEARIAQAGLAFESADVSIMPAKPVGKVYDQDPKPGLSVEPLTQVRIFVASDARVMVPNVVGHPQAEAEKMITDANLIPQSVPEIREGISTPPGSVFETNPSSSPDIVIAKGATVTLKVRQQAVVVPLVVGSDANSAQVTLFNMGLKPVVRYVDVTDVANRNKVLSQGVPQNTTVPKDTQIALTAGCATQISCRLRVIIEGRERISPKVYMDLKRAGGQ